MSRSDATRFAVPVGDRLVVESDASLWVAGDLAAFQVGGPTRWAAGRLHLTERLLAFRNTDPYGTHHQDLTVPRPQVVGATVRPRTWRDRFRRQQTDLQVECLLGGRSFVLGIHLAHPEEAERWVTRLTEAFARESPAEALAEALAAGIQDRDRYTRPLADLSFPLLWGDSQEDLQEAVALLLDRLGAAVPDAFIGGLAFDPHLVAACEDYDMVAWRAESLRVVALVNAALGAEEPRRFHRFARDLPGWEEEAPVLLFVTEAQRGRLLELGIVHERTAHDQASGGT